jgi:hydrogenase expression/formation protein HypC
MCVAVPGQIQKITDGVAEVKVGDATAKANLDLLGDEVEVGDYVLIHAGFAINRVDREEAEEIQAAIEEITNLW